MYEENESIPYQSWNLIYALQEALKRFKDEKAFVKLKRHMIMLKKLLLIWV